MVSERVCVCVLEREREREREKNERDIERNKEIDRGVSYANTIEKKY